MNKIRTASVSLSFWTPTKLCAPLKFWINTFNSILLQFHNKDNVNLNSSMGCFSCILGLHMTLHMFAGDMHSVCCFARSRECICNFWGFVRVHVKLSFNLWSTWLAKHVIRASAQQAKSIDCWLTLTICSFVSCAEQCQVGLAVPVTTLELSTLSTDLLTDAMLPSQVVAISI